MLERIEQGLRAAAPVAAICIVAVACETSKGTGSETHFVACDTDAECPAEAPRCSSGRCVAALPPDVPDGAGGTPDGSAACGPQPPSILECTQFCGSDRIAAMECQPDGTWRCPDFAPVRVSDCPEDTCWFPGATCCGNDGEPVPGACPGGGAMVCPPGSVERDPVDGCSTTCPSGDQTSEPPYAVTFRFTNEAGAPIGVWQGCQIAHSISGCIDGYTEPLPTFNFCTPECGTADGCGVVCGACQDAPLPVAAGSAATLAWSGQLFETRSEPPCGGCVVRHGARPGAYRIRVPVYPAEPLLQEGGGYYRTALYVLAIDFTLPDADGIVEIPIGQSPYVVPCGDGSGMCITRLDPDSPASGCQLEPSTTDACPAFAPRRFRCAEAVPLDPSCVDGSSGGPWEQTGDNVVRCCP
jgi:hypothetical protein